MSQAYGFILNMWVLRKMDVLKVQSYVPKYITQEEADTILATPQTGVLAPQV